MTAISSKKAYNTIKASTTTRFNIETEFVEAVPSLKAGNSLGHNNVFSELIKRREEAATSAMTELFQRFLKEKSGPMSRSSPWSYPYR
ncbi:hypothetical protein DPMN_169508 [Dreissena polymorpha]|uniref:Uncharacterized protein n=1 Tax=Dreissena polymorpha TaxID=45954 RepID=A0A9D4DWP3_DREPO|nr:hypothetical protein DPMN_169508 [Dreissena polymorpha]